MGVAGDGLDPGSWPSGEATLRGRGHPRPPGKLPDREEPQDSAV